MKKALSFAVALGLVAGLASYASAENMLSIHGDARWRGVYSQNTHDYTDHYDGTLAAGQDWGFAGNTIATQGQDTIQEMDQRYRFDMDLQVNDDVKINARWVLADQLFGNNQGPNINVAGVNVPYANTDSRGADVSSNNNYVDRANMSINTLGGTWTIGRQDASWGNKFLAYGVSVDRVKATYKAGDFAFGGYLQKNVEANTPVSFDAFGDGDTDVWGLFGVGKAGDINFGLLLNYIKYDGYNTTYDQGNGTSLTLEKGDNGYLADPFVTAKVGPATILGEFVYKGGDAVKKGNYDKSPYGGFVAAAVDLAPVTVKGLVAFYKDNSGLGVGGSGRDCDNDFAPSLLIGTCNETAIIDFGSTTNPAGDAAHADDRTYLVGAGVDFKATDKITVGALVGYLGASKYFGPTFDSKGSLTEVDVTGSYALAQNATYKLGVAYGKPKNFSPQDDNVWVVGNSVEVAW